MPRHPIFLSTNHPRAQPLLMDTAWQSLLAQEESRTAPSAKPAAVEYPAWQGDGDMPEDAPGTGTSTAVPALLPPALPDRAAQPGASSVGRMAQHTPAPGQPPTTCQPLSSCSTAQGTQGRGTLTAPNHCCYGWAGSGSPPGIPGEEGDVSTPRSLPGTPGIPPHDCMPPPQPSSGPRETGSHPAAMGQKSPGTHKATARTRAAAGAPRVRGQPAGTLAMCPQLTQLAEYRAELHKVSAE